MVRFRLRPSSLLFPPTNLTFHRTNSPPIVKMFSHEIELDGDDIFQTLGLINETSRTDK